MLRSLTVIFFFSLCDWSAVDADMAASLLEIGRPQPAYCPSQPGAITAARPAARQN